MSHRPPLAIGKPGASELLQLVGVIYECATDPSKVEELLRLLNTLLDGATAQIITRDVATGAVLDSRVSEPSLHDANLTYINHWGKLDPRLDVLASLPAGSVFRCHEHFDEAFVSSEPFYQRYFIPKRLRWTLAGAFSSGRGLSTVIADIRHESSPPFSPAAAETLQQLLPHFARAGVIAAKLEHHSVAVQSANDMVRLMPVPCLFTDQVGRCMEGNDAFANSMIELSARLVTGRVRFHDPAVQGKWEAALYETHATALGNTVRLTTASGKEWKVHLIPWNAFMPQADGVEKKLILAIFDDKVPQPTPQPGSMAAVARLTRAEVEVLGGLLKGLPAKSIATRRSASVHTVRSQIVAILEKTGYNSQKELMASFATSQLPDSAFTSSIMQSQP